MGARCWMRSWGSPVAPERRVGEGHLPSPVVQGKQPLIVTLSLLQVYTKAETSTELQGAASPALPTVNAVLVEKPTEQAHFN